jgi:phage tail protein X
MTTMKKMTTMKSRLYAALCLTLAVAAAAGCSRTSSDFKKERASRLYQNAMAEYRAGRADKAIDAFTLVVAKDPGNASARFQLACMLQDVKKEYLGAFCNFREYLILSPGSDKAKMAGDRMAECEREMARVLAQKHSLLDLKEVEKMLDPLKLEIAGKDKRIGELEKALEQAVAKAKMYADERERLVKAVMRVGANESTQRWKFKGVKELLDEEEDELEGETSVDDVAKLKAEGAEEAETHSALLPEQPQDAKAKRDEKRKESEKAAPEVQRPATYVIQEGDTLYKIANKFYGRTSAWKQIRDANKALITTDGRVKSGDEIKLP